MSIASFEDPRIEEVIPRFGQAEKMGVFVGAGASVEAGLPTWETLIERLLWRAARETSLFDKDEHCAAWIDSTLRVESLAGAASIAERLLLPDKLASVLRDVLFDDSDYSVHSVGETRARAAEDYLPGQIAMQVAYLREAFDEGHRKLHIYTTNYDDLLEVALLGNQRLSSEYEIFPYTGPESDIPDLPHIKVRHLHGFLGRDNTRGDIVLTERSYLGEGASTGWQRREVVHKLEDAPCLFLGSSLTDLNIVRYLYEHRGRRRHAIVFVRQAEIYGVPEPVREVRERVAIDRWGSEHLDVLFVDHYSDVAQLLHEIAKCRSTTGSYTPLPQRKQEYMDPLEAHALHGPDGDAQIFQRRQERLNESLVAILSEVTESMIDEGVDLSTEDGLAIGLWLVNADSKGLTAWATSDRIHTRMWGLQRAVLDPDTRWLSVSAYCTGQYQQAAPDPTNSRWKYIVGVPLWTRNSGAYGRIPVGAVTVTTQTPVDSTQLAKLTHSQQGKFARLLAEATLTRLDHLREA